MRSIFILLFWGLLTSVLIVQCQTNSTSSKINTDTTRIQAEKNPTAAEYDTVGELLNCRYELMTEDLVAMKIIDTTLTTQLSETCYCDSTVQLNDSVYYSIISVGDQAGICSYIFLASMDKKSNKVIASKYLYPDCDTDYSRDVYELYEHSIISKDKILLTKSTIFQKKNRTSLDEEENIDHKQIQKSFFTISQSGQLIDTK